MKITKYLTCGIIAAFLAAAVTPAISDYAVAYAASFRCSKCGKTIDSDPHSPGIDQRCPERGIHAWVPISSGEEHHSKKENTADEQADYQCSKCGKKIHGDHHAPGVDQHCPEGGIHAWAPLH